MRLHAGVVPARINILRNLTLSLYNAAALLLYFSCMFMPARTSVRDLKKALALLFPPTLREIISYLHHLVFGQTKL